MKLDITKGSKGHNIMEPKAQLLAKDPKHLWKKKKKKGYTKQEE